MVLRNTGPEGVKQFIKAELSGMVADLVGKDRDAIDV